MKTHTLIDEKTKEPYKTKEGIELTESVLEVGDTFIPMNNSIITKKKDVLVKSKSKPEGEMKTISNFTIVAKVKDVEGKSYKVDDNEEIFVKLTPTQAKSLQKKLNEDILINRKVFEVRNYESAEFGEQIGVFLKGKKVEPITWEEVEEEENAKNE